MKKLLFAFAFTLSLVASYGYGTISYKHGMWPVSLYRQIIGPATRGGSAAGDGLNRFTEIRKKTEVECLKQTDRTGVILAFGQSNSANHAEQMMSTRYPSKVINFFDGKCYVAGSPLLGATGAEGEFLTPLADYLIDAGVYDSIVIVSAGIGGTSVLRWQEHGDLNEMLLGVIDATVRKYTITDIIFHQGESDWGLRTTETLYRNAFKSLVSTLRRKGIASPLFFAVASKCGFEFWEPENPTALAQKSLPQLGGELGDLVIAINTDLELADADRKVDNCHFSESGQYKVARAFGEAIRQYRLK